MRLYSYVVIDDNGFAPNPFFEFCTLATDKPKIRRQAREEDWIIGTTGSSRHVESTLVFVMRVSEIVTFEQYWNDGRFQEKKPNLLGSNIERVGDNIYRKEEDGKWKQHPSLHSLYDGCPNLFHQRRDTKVNRVLIGSRFSYWGANGPTVPEDIRYFKKFGIKFDLFMHGPGHKSRFPKEMIDNFVVWFDNSRETGFLANPKIWARYEWKHQIIVPGHHHH